MADQVGKIPDLKLRATTSGSVICFYQFHAYHQPAICLNFLIRFVSNFVFDYANLSISNSA